MDRNVLFAEPASGAALLKTARALHRQQLFHDAEKKYRDSLAAAPSFDALYGLGVLLFQTGRPRDALRFLEDAAHREPASAGVQANLATAYEQLKRQADAVRCYSRSLELAPDQPLVLQRLFALLMSLRRADQAIDILEQVIAANPKIATAHHLLANVHFYAGRMEEGRRAIARAIAIEPDNAMHYRFLTEMKTFQPGDMQLVAMEALARRQANAPPNERIALKFALAKAYGDIGQPERSFATLIDANRLMRTHCFYDEAGTTGNVAPLKAAFTAERLRTQANIGNTSRTPVFILGMPRSGTTLAEQILASHPDVAGSGESTSFPDAVDAVVPDFWNDFSATGDQLETLGRSYLSAQEEIARGAIRITDKMLGNAGLAGLIHLSLPHARFIHVARDPVDTCLSCFATKFGGGVQAFAYELGELGRYYRAYEDMMAHWHSALPPGTILRVRYEDLVADLKGQTERMLDHCGLEWNDSCLSFEKKPGLVFTASAAQVRRPLYNTSVGRWRPDAAMLKPLLDGLGPYAPAEVSPATKASAAVGQTRSN